MPKILEFNKFDVFNLQSYVFFHIKILNSVEVIHYKLMVILVKSINMSFSKEF